LKTTRKGARLRDNQNMTLILECNFLAHICCFVNYQNTVIAKSACATKQSRPNERSGARDRLASLAMTIRDDGSIRSIGKSISFTLVYWRFRGKLCKD